MKILLILLLVTYALGLGPNDFLFDFVENGTAIPASSSEVKAVKRSIVKRAAASKSAITAAINNWKAKAIGHEKTTAVLNDLEKNVEKLPDGSAHLENLQKVTEKVGGNWDALTGADTQAVAKAVVEIVGVVGAFIPPPVGSIISSLMGLVSNIIGMKAASAKSIGQIVKEIIEKELRGFYKDKILSGEIQGAMEVLVLQQNWLNSSLGVDLTPEDYTLIAVNIPILSSVPLKGKLANFITTSAKSMKPDEAKDGIDLVDRYIALTSAIELLMHTMRSILANNPKYANSANSVGHTIENFRKQTVEHLSFLRSPTAENAVAMLFYTQSQHPLAEAMMDSLEIPALSVSFDGCYTLTNKRSNKQVGCTKTTSFFSTTPCNYQHADSNFPLKETPIFKFIKSGDSWRIEDRGGSLCPTASYGYYFKNEGCTAETLFKIAKLADGNFVIANEKFPGEPLSMESPNYWLKVTDTKPFSAENPEYVFKITSRGC